MDKCKCGGNRDMRFMQKEQEWMCMDCIEKGYTFHYKDGKYQGYITPKKLDDKNH